MPFYPYIHSLPGYTSPAHSFLPVLDKRLDKILSKIRYLISVHGYWEWLLKKPLLSALLSVQKRHKESTSMPREYFWYGEVISQLAIKKLTQRSSISNKQQQGLILPSIFPPISPGPSSVPCYPAFPMILCSWVCRKWPKMHWGIVYTQFPFLRPSSNQGTAGHNPAQKPK